MGMPFINLIHLAFPFNIILLSNNFHYNCPTLITPVVYYVHVYNLFLEYVPTVNIDDIDCYVDYVEYIQLNYIKEKY